jgi:[ribosomal protein S18]-alanine N-acetyltransferase
VVTEPLKIIPMKHGHIPACNKITAVSEPWKTLGEGIDFAHAIKSKQAHICKRGKATAGFVIFTPEPVFARGGYLRAIGVAPAMQGQGVGKKLMSFAEQMTARRAPNLYLCVSSFNRKAQAFYKNLRYVRIGAIPDLILPGKSEYIYRKRLNITR